MEAGAALGCHVAAKVIVSAVVIGIGEPEAG
jgi:hypothetical protein